jgi:hypothetical protein
VFVQLTRLLYWNRYSTAERIDLDVDVNQNHKIFPAVNDEPTETKNHPHQEQQQQQWNPSSDDTCADFRERGAPPYSSPANPETGKRSTARFANLDLNPALKRIKTETASILTLELMIECLSFQSVFLLQRH